MENINTKMVHTSNRHKYHHKNHPMLGDKSKPQPVGDVEFPKVVISYEKHPSSHVKS